MEHRDSDQILWERGVDDPCDDVTHWLSEPQWIEQQRNIRKRTYETEHDIQIISS